jgi:hypothetical protein
VVSEIRLYVEGGGDSKDTKAFLRQGFRAFLTDLVSVARAKGIRWQIVMCGARNATFDAFNTSVRQNPKAFNVLVVDAEQEVHATPWAHLQARDHWDPRGTSDEHCHLMTQAMEAWLIADVDALERFYGPGFNRNSIPNRPDIEQVPKANLEPSLKAATRNTQKGEYRKIHHASRLLAILDTALVRRSSRYCDRLFEVLLREMG